MATHERTLEKALEIISQPGAWTKGTLARDSAGKPVFPWNPAAVSFCIIGAMHLAAKQLGGKITVGNVVYRDKAWFYEECTNEVSLSGLNEAAGSAEELVSQIKGLLKKEGDRPVSAES